MSSVKIDVNNPKRFTVGEIEEIIQEIIDGQIRNMDVVGCPDKTYTNSAPTPLNTQVGGDHYTKLAIQPMEYSMANKLDPCQHTAIKYITRFRDKGGIEDLEKAKDVIDMLIHFER